MSVGNRIAKARMNAGYASRACAAQGWYGGASGRRNSWESCQAPSSDPGQAIVAVWALYEGIFRDDCVMNRTLEEATLEIAARVPHPSLRPCRHDFDFRSGLVHRLSSGGRNEASPMQNRRAGGDLAERADAVHIARWSSRWRATP